MAGMIVVYLYVELAACYAQMGHIDKAQAAMVEHERQPPTTMTPESS